MLIALLNRWRPIIQGILGVFLIFFWEAGAVPLQHGKNLTPELREKLEASTELSIYFVSEKLDGVRGYWDGEKLWTRQGYPIKAPLWFTENLGKKPLDGELWLGRNQFEETSQVVRNDSFEDPRWKVMHYMIFDLPGEAGSFAERVSLMESYIPQLPQHVKMIPQERLTWQMLDQRLEEVVKLGGEGLMLHHSEAEYRPYRRVDHLLKVKPVFDAEAKVIAILPGKGKYQGKMGALLVELKEGTRFKIGSGFSDDDRENPPKEGEIITFKYSGLTQKGIPRFARFWRVRHELKELP